MYKSTLPHASTSSCVLSSGCPCCSDSEASRRGTSRVAVVQNATVLELSGFPARASATSY